jgi:hypothetical protein
VRTPHRSLDVHNRSAPTVEDRQVELPPGGAPASAEVKQEVRGVGGGKLIGSVRDADGNVIGLLQMP